MSGVNMADCNLPFSPNEPRPVEIKTIPQRFDAFENLLVIRSPFLVLMPYRIGSFLSNIKPAHNIPDAYLPPRWFGYGRVNEVRY